MRIQIIQKIINFFRVKIDDVLIDSNTFKLLYFKNRKHKNAGDMFNENIMHYFNLKYKKTIVTNANLSCVGSILDCFFVPQNSNVSEYKSDECLVVGSGFLEPSNTLEKLRKKVNVKALRGKLSYERFIKAGVNLNDIVLADPGILASYIYPMTCEKKYNVGIIPHYVDKGSPYLKNNIQLNNNNYIFIDIEQNVEDVLNQISQCECILSSSLHGLIFADSYNIPNRQIILSDLVIGGTYKFEDYYSAYNLELPEVVDIRKKIINDESIDWIKNTYISKDDMIKHKQSELIKIFENLSCKN